MSRFPFFGTLLTAGAFAICGGANAATFTVLLDTDTIDGGGTITIDDTLIAPNALVNYLDPLVQILVNFNGVTYDSGFDNEPAPFGDTVFVFDALGEEIVGVDDQGEFSNFTDFASSANPSRFIGINDGAIPGTFFEYETTSGGATTGLRGAISITRVSEVPVPASLPMLGAALGLFGVLRKRKLTDMSR